eukprot:TRINITY_DN6191_c0_g1_i1.p1 TRINITY_DN6191_c0_g1~~TRINITY_DN6191_c0_g1_i1.p1  ORF type:complete len:102 (+),score=23.22 TRINITY_DN6191_c0_g1_i1:3-308(+)
MSNTNDLNQCAKRAFEEGAKAFLPYAFSSAFFAFFFLDVVTKKPLPPRTKLIFVTIFSVVGGFARGQNVFVKCRLADEIEKTTPPEQKAPPQVQEFKEWKS